MKRHNEPIGGNELGVAFDTLDALRRDLDDAVAKGEARRALDLLEEIRLLAETIDEISGSAIVIETTDQAKS